MPDFLPGPNKDDCPCGCGLFGLVKMGTGHVRGCKCRPCLGRRNRAKGDTKARNARKALGLPGANTRHEELWGGPLRIESKAGAQIQPAWTAYIKMEAQSEQHRSFGDHRPFVGVAMPDGTKDGLVMMRLSVFEERIRPLLEDG
jgi:hypothetical protein